MEPARYHLAYVNRFDPIPNPPSWWVGMGLRWACLAPGESRSKITQRRAEPIISRFMTAVSGLPVRVYWGYIYSAHSPRRNEYTGVCRYHLFFRIARR